MGNRSDRKKKFLLEHPICIFCGGLTKSEEWDHVPSRQYFSERKWPKGFVFPSCSNCNRATRNLEQIIAFISRVAAESGSDTDEFERTMHGVFNNFPDIVNELIPTHRQVRSFVRRSGYSIPSGKTTRDVPVFSVRGPLVNGAIKAFAQKFFSALHYKHSGAIIPHTGGINFHWGTNAQPLAAELLSELKSVLVPGKLIEQANSVFGDQLRYAYAAQPDGSGGIYHARFRSSFEMLGLVVIDLSHMPLIEDRFIARPMNWK